MKEVIVDQYVKTIEVIIQRRKVICEDSDIMSPGGSARMVYRLENVHGGGAGLLLCSVARTMSRADCAGL